MAHLDVVRGPSTIYFLVGFSRFFNFSGRSHTFVRIDVALGKIEAATNTIDAIPEQHPLGFRISVTFTDLFTVRSRGQEWTESLTFLTLDSFSTAPSIMKHQMKGPLTPKQLAFVLEYIKDGKGSRS